MVLENITLNDPRGRVSGYSFVKLVPEGDVAISDHLPHGAAELVDVGSFVKVLFRVESFSYDSFVDLWWLPVDAFHFGSELSHGFTGVLVFGVDEDGQVV